MDTQLAEMNKKNRTDLVGGHPLNSSSGSDSDSDFKDIPFPQDDTMQQVSKLSELSRQAYREVAVCFIKVAVLL